MAGGTSRLRLICCGAVLWAFVTQATPTSHGDRMAQAHTLLTQVLAQRMVPKANGAMGRNRAGYFHVRFQMGMHHLVDHGLASQDPKAILKFVKAAEYALRHQLPDGDFQLTRPAKLAGLGQASPADRASGVAFFTYSLGVGLHALHHSAWWQSCQACAPLRTRVVMLTQQLQPTLVFLLKQEGRLMAADRNAPNRLLFNGLAFYSLSQLLDSEPAAAAAHRFIQQATQQVHVDGYFIEGGGFDSSYNGVASALCLRLVLMGYPEPNLVAVCDRALTWQIQRILPSGEIDSRGNSRVRTDGTGEAFLGRSKDVDAAHTIEALLLFAVLNRNPVTVSLAQQVLQHYRNKR